MSQPLVTILVPHYKTLDLTKLCLRLIRKNTDLKKVKVIVLDNGSKDKSTDYLREVKWITLIERDTTSDKTPQLSHSNSLDEALAIVDTPFVLSIHTDTIVKKPGWIEFLLKQFADNPQIAGVGSWKLESKPWHRRFAKRIEYAWQSLYYPVIGKTDHRLEGKGENYYYLRSHCALYRTELLKKHHLGFSDGEATTGKVMHQKLLALGYEMIFLPSETLGAFVDHWNHATMVLHPELGARDSTISKGLKRIQKGFKEMNAPQVLQDASLDQ